MITIAASELDFYQKKITRLEMELIVLHEELALANAKTPDNLREKYDLLLLQVSGEKEAWDKKYGEEREKQEKAVGELNTRWETVLQERTAEFRQQIEALTEEKSAIKSRLVEMEMRNLKLQREIDEGDTEILQIKLDSFKKENERLKVETNEAYLQCEKQIAEMRRHLEIKVEETKEREKSYYRDQIEALEKVVEDLEAVLASEREKISPEREQLIAKLQQEMASQKTQQDRELEKLATLLEKRNREFASYRQQAEKKEAHNLENMKDLTGQLKSL
jgi:septal ring factor EnvC (AmiA/AmiB activator)